MLRTVRATAKRLVTQADQALGWAEKHPVRSLSLVAWCGCLASPFLLHPGQLLQTQDVAEARPSIFGQRWPFYTRDPERTVQLASGGGGTGSKRDQRQRALELAFLEGQLPAQAQRGELEIQGQSGMLLCRQHVIVRRVALSSRSRATDVYVQPVYVTC